MDIHRITRDKEKQLDLVRETQKVYYNSEFNFLKSHRGFRPGNIHLFIGTSGGGKSTLVRSLLIDVLHTGEKVLLFLSEETKKDFELEFVKTGYNEKELDNLVIMSELDDSICETTWEKLDYVQSCILHHKAKFFFYDNITTSGMYTSLSLSDQDKFVTRIKSFTAKEKITSVVMAHTRAEAHEFYKGILSQSDIRGSKQICNLAPFLYIMQRFQIEEHFYPTIKIHKHRSQQINESVFFLRYSKDHAIYTGDHAVTFDAFKEAYEKRNRL